MRGSKWPSSRTSAGVLVAPKRDESLIGFAGRFRFLKHLGQLTSFAPRYAQTAREHSSSHQKHERNAPAHRTRSCSVGPHRGQWLKNPVCIGMVDALIPSLGS